MTDAPTDQPRYRLDSRIATGGMGEVWRAADTVLGREVAVKVLKPEYADDPMFRSRFQAEARHAAALHHPGVASVFDAGEFPDADGSGVPRPYLVMELVPGQPLSALLRGGEPMPPDTAADLVAQATDAVAAAHALGIVHRDMKPGNLLVTPDGRVKITDFGIARAADGTAGVTQTGQVIGTPAYLSPEQAEGKPATSASDIYSLGVVLYECLAGTRPFVSDTPVGIALSHLRDEPPPLPDSVPRQLRDTVEVALAKAPADRFESMTAFGDALRGGPVPLGAAAAGAAGVAAAGAGGAGHTQVLTGVSAGSTAGAGPTTGARRSSLPGWLPWAGAALAVLLLVLLIAWFTRGEDDPAPTRNTPPAATTEPTPSPEPSSSAPEPTEPTEPAGIEVVAEEYVGMSKDDAKARLEALGLEVKEQEVDNDGTVEQDTVVDVVPAGTLQEGDEVTIFVAGPPPDEDEDEEDSSGPGNSEGKGNGKGSKDKD